jgi:hypothetical protein
MGFEIRRELRLDLDETPLAGAQVSMRSCSSATFARLWDSEVTVDDQRALFAEHLVSWNLSVDGEDLPLTPASLAALDNGQWYGLLRAWGAAMTTVAAPLGQRSSGGDTSPVASMSMETL